MFLIGESVRRFFFGEAKSQAKAVDAKDKFVRLEHLLEWQAQWEAEHASLQLENARLEVQLVRVVQEARVSVWFKKMLIRQLSRTGRFAAQLAE